MEEMKEKKRGWVKNAAIVFLSVMLILTFFSNTFMNRSLSEVATKYVVSGEITTKIRGSGTVSANETYEVTLAQSRKVESVKVKVGDEVQEGDVLFTLDASDSQELKQAEEALRAANLNYQRALINATDTDYAKEDRDIQLAREDLEAAQAELNSYSGNGTLTLAEAKSKMETAKAVMDASQKEVDKYQKQLSNLSPGGGGTSSLYSQYQAAEQTLSDARRALSAKLLSMGDTYKSLMKLVVDDRLENAAADTGVKEDLTELKRLYLEYEYEKFAGTSSSVSAAQKNLNDYVGKEENKNLKAVSERFVKEWEPQLNVYMDAAATDGYIGFSGEVKADEKQAAAYTALKKLIEDVSTAQRERDAAYSSYLDAMSSDDSGEYSRVNRLLQKAQESLDSATTSYEKAKNIYDGMSSATTAVKEKQRALEDLLFALDEQKKQDNKNIKLEALDLQEKRYAIADAQETVEQLREDATEPEVKAKVSGVIGSITVTAGKTAEAGTTICTIIVPDMGYNVSFSVTADQARKVRVGDEASIANYYGGDIKATLSNIRTDPQNPQTNRILTFDITGEVEAGTTLNLSVGQKSAQYDTIVPNSAIRSDSNGDFVLVVTSKSSPLGNRYVATRVDVEKIISDDTNTAVTGGLNAYDYVITTSSKPIKDKDLVRLAE
ncbi:MAG: biotin/lipoyl-binding protein [Oscillospiraceae bacterium]|nr:biotin/lipoyl-binding protein [Oscillospiraceae bacterium]